MHSIRLHDVDFHIPTEKERKEIRNFQKKYTAKCWGKRFLITFAIVGIIIIFQLVARQTVPYMFGKRRTVERLLTYGISAFLGINILSYFQLLFRNRVVFRIKKTKVIKLRVKKKIVVSDIMRYTNIRIKYKYLSCELPDGTFILNQIWVRGVIPFSNIKEGQEIYVERLNHEEQYKYYFVA